MDFKVFMKIDKNIYWRKAFFLVNDATFSSGSPLHLQKNILE